MRAIIWWNFPNYLNRKAYLMTKWRKQFWKLNWLNKSYLLNITNLNIIFLSFSNCWWSVTPREEPPVVRGVLAAAMWSTLLEGVLWFDKGPGVCCAEDTCCCCWGGGGWVEFCCKLTAVAKRLFVRGGEFVLTLIEVELLLLRLHPAFGGGGCGGAAAAWSCDWIVGAVLRWWGGVVCWYPPRLAPVGGTPLDPPCDVSGDDVIWWCWDPSIWVPPTETWFGA